MISNVFFFFMYFSKHVTCPAQTLPAGFPGSQATANHRPPTNPC